MKIRVLPTGISPDYYEVSGQTITVYEDGDSELFDFSSVPVDAEEIKVGESEVIKTPRPIRKAEIIDGELHIDITQQVGAGNWLKSKYFDAADYDPEALNVVFDDSKPFRGNPTYKTKSGVFEYSTEGE